MLHSISKRYIINFFLRRKHFHRTEFVKTRLLFADEEHIPEEFKDKYWFIPTSTSELEREKRWALEFESQPFSITSVDTKRRHQFPYMVSCRHTYRKMKDT